MGGLKKRVGIRALRRHCGKCTLGMAFAHGLIKWLPVAQACSDQVQMFSCKIVVCSCNFFYFFISFYLHAICLRSVLLCETGSARTFVAPVLVFMLQSISKCACSSKIWLFQRTIFVTIVSDHSFFEKWVVHAMLLAHVHLCTLQ